MGKHRRAWKDLQRVIGKTNTALHLRRIKLMDRQGQRQFVSSVPFALALIQYTTRHIIERCFGHCV